MAQNVKFVPPRVPLVDLRTGQITREWYLLFSSFFEGADGGGGLPDPVDDIQSAVFAESDPRIDSISQEVVRVPDPNNTAALDEIAAQQAVFAPPPDASRPLDEAAQQAISVPPFDPRRALDDVAMLMGDGRPPLDLHNRLDELELLIAAAIQPLNPTLLSFGSYTPALTAVANVGSSAAYPCGYLRIGSIVIVFGKFDLAATAAPAVTQLGISLPVASNIGADYDCAGTAAPNSGAVSYPGAINGDAANDRAQLNMLSPNTAALGMFFVFGYRVI